MAVSSGKHETRVDRAFAMNGWVVFCSCGKLTGFADTATGADEIAADHVAKHAPAVDFGGNFRHGFDGVAFVGVK